MQTRVTEIIHHTSYDVVVGLSSATRRRGTTAVEAQRCVKSTTEHAVCGERATFKRRFTRRRRQFTAPQLNKTAAPKRVRSELAEHQPSYFR